MLNQQRRPDLGLMYPRQPESYRPRNGYLGRLQQPHRLRHSPQCQLSVHLFFDANIWHAELPCLRSSLTSLEP